MYGFLVPTGGGDPIPLRKEEIIVGRKDDCDVVLRFSNVSSKHCRLVLSHGYWYIIDMQSTNGVKVNGVKVTDHRVDPGATLAISKNLFKIQYNPKENGAVGPPPGDILYEGEMLSRSLMERAGLKRPTTPKVENVGRTDPEMNEVSVHKTPIPTPINQDKKNFFEQLQFD